MLARILFGNTIYQRNNDDAQLDFVVEFLRDPARYRANDHMFFWPLRRREPNISDLFATLPIEIVAASFGISLQLPVYSNAAARDPAPRSSRNDSTRRINSGVPDAPP